MWVDVSGCDPFFAGCGWVWPFLGWVCAGVGERDLFWLGVGEFGWIEMGVGGCGWAWVGVEQFLSMIM